MKIWKIAVFLIICCCSSSVNAQTFNFQINSNYKYKVIFKNGNTIQTITHNMYKITDNSGNFFYSVEPNKPIFTSKNYTKNEIPFDLKVMQKISKIIYYGYGYKNHTTEEYYIATQYMIFKELGVSSVSIVDSNNQICDIVANEIKEIEKSMEEKSYEPKEYITTEESFYINNPYILKHYTLEGENISVISENNAYKLIFLEEKDIYTIHLKSKNNCLLAEYWKCSASAALLGKSDLCEEDKTIDILKTPKKEEQPPIQSEEDVKIPEQSPIKEEEEEQKLEQEITVNMPNTSKQNYIGLIILLLIGNVYYVCKE